MSWFSSKQDYDIKGSSNITYGETKMTYGSDSKPTPKPSDSGFETPENYRHMTYADFGQHTR